MTVDLPQINCTARPAAGTEHVKPRRPGDQRGPDRRRPQHVPARDKLLIPTLDDGLRSTWFMWLGGSRGAGVVLSVICSTELQFIRTGPNA
jgi:hypothetical protein